VEVVPVSEEVGPLPAPLLSMPPPVPQHQVESDLGADNGPPVEISDLNSGLDLVPAPVESPPDPEAGPHMIEPPGAAVDDAAPFRLEDPSDQTLPPGEQWSDHLDESVPTTDVAPTDEGGPLDDPYADIWNTRIGSIEDAAVRPVELVDGGSPIIGSPSAADARGSERVAEDDGRDGDHDGHTRAVDPALLAGALEAMEDAPGRAGGVPSSPCINGHPNPPFAVTCRRCLAPVRDTVERVARADAGVLVLPDGERVEVDRTIIVGRKPRAYGLYTGDPPRLVGLADQPDISRTHVVIELSGWTATVTDQDSVNGTEVQLPGKPLEQLRPRSPMALVVGARIVLAGEVELKLEGGE
jgi:hypothetical protein